MTTNPIIVSAGWDKVVKVFNLTNCKLKNNLYGHAGYINTVTVSPDGSLCASGGKVRGYTWLCGGSHKKESVQETYYKNLFETR